MRGVKPFKKAKALVLQQCQVHICYAILKGVVINSFMRNDNMSAPGLVLRTIITHKAGSGFQVAFTCLSLAFHLPFTLAPFF